MCAQDAPVIEMPVTLSRVGVEIVRKALRIPCYTIAANAGVDAQEIVTRVMQEQQDIGYDALHATFVDMMKAGIIDPTKVCLHCLAWIPGSRVVRIDPVA